MTAALRVISSMATRALLEELLARYRDDGGGPVTLESVGGVEAARRLREGERFDVAVLAADAIEGLADDGVVDGASRVALVRSAVAIAVPAGQPAPDISTEDALRASVLAAPSLGYSTGPSGAALAALFERWGIAAELAGRIRVPPPGVPVGSLLQSGEIALGFQQLSELMHLAGVDVVGPMPAPIAIETVFAGGVCSASEKPGPAARLLEYLASPRLDPARRRHGMMPTRGDGDSAN